MTSYDVHEEVVFRICRKDVIRRPARIMTVHACSQDVLENVRLWLVYIAPTESVL